MADVCYTVACHPYRSIVGHSTVVADVHYSFFSLRPYGWLAVPLLFADAYYYVYKTKS